MNKIIKMAIKEINKNVIPKIPIKTYKVISIYRKGDYLGYYADGSYDDITTIKLNISQIKKSDFEYPNIGLYGIILSTILHELGHALQEFNEKCYNEEEAESFAYDYCHFGRINKI